MPAPDRTTERQLLKAMRQLDQALAARPREPGLLVLRARAAARLDGPLEAARWWLQAAAAQDGPEAADSYCEAAACYEEGGDPKAARRAWRDVLRIEPTSEQRLVVAAFYRRTDQLPEAIELLSEVAVSQDHVEALDACDQLFEIDEDPMPWARRAVEQAAKARLPERFGPSLIRLAHLHRERGDERKYLAYLDRARPYVDEADWPELQATAG